MQSGQKEVCPSCGLPLSGHVPRCPACGFLLAAAPGPVYQNSLPPKRPRPTAGAPSSLPTAVMLGGLGLTLALVVAGFWLVREHDNAQALQLLPSTAPPAVPAASPSTAATALEPTTLFAKAKSAALGWHVDAALVEIDISPVTQGKVEPTGKLVFKFGKPAAQKLGPGTPVQSTGFVVTADERGLQGEEHLTGKALSVAEPNCIFEDVLGKVEKSGVPRSERLDLHYALSEKGARGVWRVSRVGETAALRILDGASCAIIVR